MLFCGTFKKGAHGVMLIIIGSEFIYLRSNPEEICLHFT